MPLSVRTLPQFGASSFALNFTNKQKDGDPNPPDYRTVVSTEWIVTRPDGTVVTWNPVDSEVTETSSVSTYVFAADGSDLSQLETYAVAIKHFDTSGGWFPGEAFSFRVVPANRWTGQ